VIHWLWLIPVFVLGCALGWHNGREFQRMLPFLLDGLNKPTTHCVEAPQAPIHIDPNLN
jgi:hypothetical protein